MMNQQILESALQYHDEGLCVIPCQAGRKAPAIDWEPYQHRRSTRDEVTQWFGNGSGYNIGTVHGEVSGGYVLIDIDHDSGVFKMLCDRFPELTGGRVTQSGSLEGYHVHVMTKQMPDFGYDERRDRPKGNRTWKTSAGSVNLRARWCQSVQPPSLHPSGNRYHFLRQGEIITADSLSPLMAWLDTLAPPPIQRAVQRRPHRAAAEGTNLVELVRSAWPNAIEVFKHFGMMNRTEREPNGETRLKGNGGLLVAEDGETWYNFSAEEGGGVIEAWAWCRYGSVAAKKSNFRAILLEMAQAANLDAALFYQNGDESVRVRADGDRSYWTRRTRRWGMMR